MPAREIRLDDFYDAGPVTLRRALQRGTELLSQMGLESARLDAELLLGRALGCKRERLYQDYETLIESPARELYRSLLERRARREPVAYITGEREFWSLGFYVAPAVLVPRPETELLVEVALGLAQELRERGPVKILDLGTGSGAIAVSLARELGGAEVWATDISCRALEVARSNAGRHGVQGKIFFLAGDGWAPFRGREPFLNLIVSNPPYVRRGELLSLPPEVCEWEPALALDGGVDGLDFYRRIAAEAHLYLANGGFLAIEIGADMGAEVCRLFAGAGCYSAPSVYQDYAGRDRVVVVRKHPFDSAK